MRCGTVASARLPRKHTKMGQKSPLKTGHSYFQWIYALLANSTLLVYGMETGWISPITSLLQSDASPTGYPMSDSEISWTASSMSITATFGVISYSFIADRYGRKIGVIVIAFFEGLSWILRLVNSSTTLLIIARAIAGLGAGGCFTIVPMYVKEISQEDLAGILGTFPILMNTIGIFMMYVIGAWLDYDVVIIIMTILPIVAIAVMIKAPESPAFLVKKDKIDKAKETVAFLRGLDKDDVLVKRIVDNMITEEILYKSLPNITFLNILKNNRWRRGFILAAFLYTFYEINGGYVIVTYASKMLSSTGIQFDISPEVQSLSFPIVMVIASLALTSYVERCGRKPLLFTSFMVTTVAMFSLAVMIIVQTNKYGNVPAWMPLLSLIIAVAMNTGGVSPLCSVVMTEMFNFQVRAKLMGIVITYAWFLSFIAQSSYPILANSFGEFAPYVFYGGVNLAGVFFMIFLPETKGKTEEEIFKNVKKNADATVA